MDYLSFQSNHESPKLYPPDTDCGPVETNIQLSDSGQTFDAASTTHHPTH